jgi:UDP-N-acetyl-D-mannosaminuronic acid dehydrogenase
MSRYSNLAVIGCGSVGLAVAAAFASRGFDVQGVDTDVDRVAQLNLGNMSFVDPDLADAVVSATVEGRLSFCRTFSRPGDASCAFIVTVPTPVDDAKKLDRTFLNLAVDAIGCCARDGDLLVVRSTVPVGTTRRLAQSLRDRGVALRVACCPDRSLAGRSFLDQFLVPNVIGAMDPESGDAASSLFANLGAVHYADSPEAAEILKLLCNVQRDVAFALVNQFALICDHLNLDFHEIRRVASDQYPRFSIPRPGPVGGPCLSKDAYLLAESVDWQDGLTSLPMAARCINETLLDHVITAILDHAKCKSTNSFVVAVLGLAFKGEPAVLDRRDSFGTKLLAGLRERMPQIVLRDFDPVESENTDAILYGDLIAAADVVVLANDHPLLQRFDFKSAAAAMRGGGLIYDVTGVAREGSTGLPNGVKYSAFGGGRHLQARTV